MKYLFFVITCCLIIISVEATNAQERLDHLSCKAFVEASDSKDQNRVVNMYSSAIQYLTFFNHKVTAGIMEDKKYNSLNNPELITNMMFEATQNTIDILTLEQLYSFCKDYPEANIEEFCRASWLAVEKLFDSNKLKYKYIK